MGNCFSCQKRRTKKTPDQGAGTIVIVHSSPTTANELGTPAATLKIEEVLRLPEIIENIFEYLPLEDLRRARSVSKEWKHVSRPFVENKDVIKLGDRNAMRAFMKMVNESGLQFRKFQFLEYLPNRSLEFRKTIPPIKKLSLFFSEPQNGIYDKKHSPFFAEFAISCPELKEIELVSLPHEVKTSGITNGFLPVPKFQKMNHITLHHDNLENRYEPKFLIDLFHLCPNLEGISTVIKCDYLKQVQEEMIIYALVMSPTYRTVTCLKLAFLTSDMLYVIVNHLPKSRFRKFSVELLDEPNSEDFQKFLNTHAGSLETFEFGLSRSQNLRVNFPKMPKLKDLTITFCYKYVDSVPSLGYMEYGILFPKLKTLRIRALDKVLDFEDNYAQRWSFKKHEMFPVDEVTKAENVQELELPQNLGDPNRLLGISHLFPNVKNLKIGAQLGGNSDEGMFRVIWDSPWVSSVQTLELCFFVNCCTVALQPKGPSHLDNIFGNWPGRHMRERIKNEEQEMPSLAAMTELKYLIISKTPTCFPQFNLQLTDATGDEILSRMHRLQGIRVDKGLTRLTDECVERICSAVELINIFPPERSLRPEGVVQLVKYPWQDQGMRIDYEFKANEFGGFDKVNENWTWDGRYARLLQVRDT